MTQKYHLLKYEYLNTIHKHLETPKTTARLLFADFSSAFHTMQPHILAEKLITRFHLNLQLTQWIIELLTNRSQRVLVNHTLTDTLLTFTGSPQGCVLSPLLFILYTDDCRSTKPNCHFVKSAAGVLSSHAQHHSSVLQDFAEWCGSSCLELNISKTKEMLVTFSPKQRQVAEAVTAIIQEEPVEIVEEYLGTLFDNLLKFSSDTEEILNKCHQRQYLLRKLKSFGMNKDILTTFKYAFNENVITFSFTRWFHSITLQNRIRLLSVVTVCSRIIGQPVGTLPALYDQQTVESACRILQDPSRVLFGEFEWRKGTFIPRAVRLLNAEH